MNILKKILSTDKKWCENMEWKKEELEEMLKNKRDELSDLEDNKDWKNRFRRYIENQISDIENKIEELEEEM